MAYARLKLIQHLSYEALTSRYLSCTDVKERARLQAIWLLSRPREPLSAEEAAAVIGFSPDWVRKLARRYNALGPDGLRDRREPPNAPKPLRFG